MEAREPDLEEETMNLENSITTSTFLVLYREAVLPYFGVLESPFRSSY